MPVTDHSTATMSPSREPSRVVQVPLGPGKGCAKINEDDLTRLRNAGYVGKWFLNSNGRGADYVKVYYKTNNKNVAFLIMAPPKGYVVRYWNNDRTDLRRSNLVLQPRKAQLRELAKAGISP